jgi:hypothetical protein
MIRTPGDDRPPAPTPLPLPAYLPEPPTLPGRTPIGLAERWRRLDHLRDGQQPPRRGAVPGPQSAPYRASTALSAEITFRRAVDVPFSCSQEALLDWWRSAGHDGILEVGHCRLTGPTRPDPPGPAFHMEARIGRGLPWLWVTADMELFPWLGSFGTQLTLCPRRTVHPGRHYFATGHALLDVVVAVLQRHHAGARPQMAPPAAGRQTVARTAAEEGLR